MRGVLLLLLLLLSAIAAQEEEGVRAVGRTRNLSVVLDPKTVELKPDAAAVVQQSSPNQQEMLESLKLTERIWLRGRYASPNRKHGRGISNYWGMEEQVAAAQAQWETEHESNGVASSLSVCDRVTEHPIMRYPLADIPCPDFSPEKPTLLLEFSDARGRTGNNLIEFLHAVQIARDRGIQLGTTSQSWAMNLVTSLWFETVGNTPESHAERLDALEGTFCMKIFRTQAELAGWTDIIHMSTGDLFSYHSPLHMAEYIPSQLDLLRRLFSRYNTGRGVDSLDRTTRNMCSGLEALFPTSEGRSSAVYTAIHSRKLEGDAGLRILGKLYKRAGCDPHAALEMRPEYIKAILGPLGMLDHPIVFIWDGEDPAVLERLLADPEIGPQMQVLDQAHTSLGGDLAMAIMSDVFIGNPASSFSTFIGKARLAFGKGHNELWWGVDPRSKKWRPVCGDHCLFDYAISGNQA